MNHALSNLRSLALIATLIFSGATFASGTHAGGHEHDGDETAIGKPGKASEVGRTITIEMDDNMRYTPAEIQTKQGETVRFIVKNKGQIKHELSLGTQPELLEHLEQMKKFPNMEHDDPSSISLAPGKKGEIIWQFTKAGTVHFGCLMPGHYEAGMKGQVTVGLADGHQPAAAMTDGEVKKVDIENGKITIKHGPITHLDMPGMTMVFTVKDKGAIAHIKPKDKVQFMVVNDNGTMTLTAISTAP